MKNVLQLQPFYLNQPLGASDTTIQVRGLKDSRGTAITAMPSGVTEIVVTIEPQSTTNQEIISFTGITDNGNGIVTLTGVTRNLSPTDATVTLSATVPHANNATCIVSDSPQALKKVLVTDEIATITAVHTFGVSPVVPDATSANQPVSKSQLDLAVLGTVPASSTTVLGAVRVATDPTKTLGTATMTIASPCVVTLNSHALTANDTIRFTTTGSLPTGLVVGTTYYVISTGLTANTFQLALTAGGTAINTSGSQSGTHTLYRTTPYAINDQDPRLPTQDENDAMQGTTGLPSGTNRFVTQEYFNSADLAGLFGTGADGDVVISSNTNLTRDMFYNNLTVNNGFTLNPNGFRIFVRGTLTLNGTIGMTGGNGGNGSGVTGGAAGAVAASPGSIYGGIAGIIGGAGGNAAGTNPGAAAGSSSTTNNVGNLTGVASGAGGAGGAGGNGGAGGGAGATPTSTVAAMLPYVANWALNLHTMSDATLGFMKVAPQAAGGGGGGAGGNNGGGGNGGNGGGGGGGGASGGLIAVYAKVITISATGAITSRGGNGGNGANGANAAGAPNLGGGGGGGAGSGGNGGVIVLVYASLTNGGTISCPGGTAGTVGSGGTPVGGGIAGTAGSTGNAGNAGVVYQIDI